MMSDKGESRFLPPLPAFEAATEDYGSEPDTGASSGPAQQTRTPPGTGPSKNTAKPTPAGRNHRVINYPVVDSEKIQALVYDKLEQVEALLAAKSAHELSDESLVLLSKAMEEFKRRNVEPSLNTSETVDDADLDLESMSPESPPDWLPKSWAEQAAREEQELHTLAEKIAASWLGDNHDAWEQARLVGVGDAMAGIVEAVRALQACLRNALVHQGLKVTDLTVFGLAGEQVTVSGGQSLRLVDLYEVWAARLRQSSRELSDLFDALIKTWHHSPALVTGGES